MGDLASLAARRSNDRPSAGREGWALSFALPPRHPAVGALRRDSGYSATVDQNAVGLPVSVFISIKLERQRSTELDAFAAALEPWPEVMECYLMTGEFDFLLRVVCSDLAAYEAFLRDKLTQLSGEAPIQSSFSLGRIKSSSVLPL